MKISICASDEELKHFILNHKSTVSKFYEGSKLLQYIEDCSDDEFNPKEDFFDWNENPCNDWGLYGIIADIISEETGIKVIYEVREDSEGEFQDMLSFPNIIPNTIQGIKILNIIKEYIKEVNPALI